MQDYKPNSNRFKTEEQGRSVEEKKKVEKVVKGTAKVKKKSEVRNAVNNFLNEDLDNIKSYVVTDLIIPTVKNTIYDAVVNIFDMVLFGGNGRARRNGAGSSRASYVSYNKYSDSRDNHSSSNKETRRSKYNFDDIILDTKADAEEVLSQMDALLDEYRIVTVADLYDLVGVTGEYTDQKYGWTNLRNARSVRTRDGYMLELPKPLPID